MHAEISQIPKMELFAKTIVNGLSSALFLQKVQSQMFD